MDKKIALNIRPFTRIVWKGKNLQSMLNEVSRLYTMAEWETVKRGLRRVATVHLTYDNTYDMLQQMAKDKLIFIPIAKSAYYSGFSHRHIPPRQGEPYFIYGVLARNWKDAWTFTKASEDPHLVHKVVGKLLGYPTCCIEAFNDRWKQGIIDPIWEAGCEMAVPIKVREDKWLLNAKPSIYTNQMLRYFGIRITSHLPCSFDCTATEEVGAIWSETMESISPKVYKQLVKLLQMPIVWDAYHGIVQVNTPLFIGISTTGYTDDNRVIVTK